MLKDSDFTLGSLHLTSYARPGKLFTANRALVVGRAGELRPDLFKRIIKAVVDILYESVAP